MKMSWILLLTRCLRLILSSVNFCLASNTFSLAVTRLCACEGSVVRQAARGYEVSQARVFGYIILCCLHASLGGFMSFTLFALHGVAFLLLQTEHSDAERNKATKSSVFMLFVVCLLLNLCFLMFISTQEGLFRVRRDHQGVRCMPMCLQCNVFFCN